MNKIASLSIAIVVAVFALLIATTLMTIDSKLAQREIKIISEHPTVEELLVVHKDVIGNDYEAYKGHIYRVLTYSIHILGTKGPIDIIAAALVYHDIGLWTDKMLNYIEPSIERAKKDLPGRYNKNDMKLIIDIIYWHHKITPVDEKDPKAKKIINAVRRADWIDATMVTFLFMIFPSPLYTYPTSTLPLSQQTIPTN